MLIAVLRGSSGRAEKPIHFVNGYFWLEAHGELEPEAVHRLVATGQADWASEQAEAIVLALAVPRVTHGDVWIQLSPVMSSYVVKRPSLRSATICR